MHKEKVLVHTCCAPCAAYCIEHLVELSFEPVLYFYNPNIYPKEEYSRRLEELAKYAEKLKYQLFVEDYIPIEFYEAVKNLESEPERGLRCEECFKLRLQKTKDKAVSLSINAFTTTLTISPHKNSKQIFKAANSLVQHKADPQFLEIDFKKNNGFLKSTLISKQENFYKQNYCGCKFSLRSTPH